MDFRGFGANPNDARKCVEPFCCVSDVKTVLKWISKRHGMNDNLDTGVLGDNVFKNPALFGWCQGNLVAQIVAQIQINLLQNLFCKVPFMTLLFVTLVILCIKQPKYR